MKQKFLHYEVYGQGEPVVFLPGMLGSTRYWYPLRDELKEDYKIVLVDLLGFGRSEKNPNLEYSLEQHLEYLDNTLTKVNSNEPFIIVAHSMGAVLAFYYAYTHPKKVKKLILIAPTVFKNQQEAKENILKYSSFPEIFLYGRSARILCKIFCQWLRPLTTIYLRNKFKTLPEDVVADSLLHNYFSYSKTLNSLVENQNLFSIIEQIKCPVNIVYGTLDGRAIEANYKRLASLNNNLSLQAFDSEDHNLILDQPDLILKHLKND